MTEPEDRAMTEPEDRAMTEPNEPAMTEPEDRPMGDPGDLTGAAPLASAGPRARVLAAFCPYLGLADDPVTHFAFPSSAQRCHSDRRAVAIDLAKQARDCLTSQHVTCSRYRPIAAPAKASEPALAAADVGTVAPTTKPADVGTVAPTTEPAPAPAEAGPVAPTTEPADVGTVAPTTEPAHAPAEAEPIPPTSKPAGVGAVFHLTRPASLLAPVDPPAPGKTPPALAQGRRSRRRNVEWLLIVLLVIAVGIVGITIGGLLAQQLRGGAGSVGASQDIRPAASLAAPSEVVTSPDPASPLPSEPPSEQPTATAAPTPTLAPTPTPAPSPVVHVVQRGETLTAIAERYHVSVQSIAKANSLVNPSLIVVGQKLIIPSP